MINTSNHEPSIGDRYLALAMVYEFFSRNLHPKCEANVTAVLSSYYLKAAKS